MNQEIWEAKYAQARQENKSLFPKAGAASVVEVLSSLGEGVGKTAIDAGAGEGRHTRELVKLGYQVTALEIAPSAVALGNEQAQLVAADCPNIPQALPSWQLGDARDWQPDAQVDLVLGAFIHQIDGGIFAALKNMASWVKPGGYLVLVGHAKAQHGRSVHGPKNIDILWSASELGTALTELGFQIDRCEDKEITDPVLAENPAGCGTGAPTPLHAPTPLAGMAELNISIKGVKRNPAAKHRHHGSGANCGCGGRHSEQNSSAGGAASVGHSGCGCGSGIARRVTENNNFPIDTIVIGHKIG